MKKILVVDDSATARMFSMRCMEIAHPEPVEFMEAANGKEALDLVRQQHVDLVLSDLNMPVMDGVEFVRRVSASPKLNGMPVVVVTSAANPGINAELISLGAAGIIEKPLSPMKLTDTLNQVEGFKEETGSLW